MGPKIPHREPGVPDTRGPVWYIWWLVRRQPWRVLRGSLVGTAWMVGLSVRPYLVARAIDGGLRRHDNRALLWWVAAIVVAGIGLAYLGIMRHRTMTFVREDASARSAEVLLRQLSRIGAVLPRKLAAGEVATVGGADIVHTSQVLTMTGPGVGAVIAYAVVAVVLWWVSPMLALCVLLGVPAVVVIIGPLLRRLERAESAYRHQQGQLTTRAGDIVAGLRVLAGVGGRGLFARRYAARSQDLLIEGGYDMIRGRVAARRIVALLTLVPDDAGGRGVAPAPDGPADLHAPATGLTVRAGRLLGVAADDPAEAIALADRLGRFVASEVTWGGVPLAEIALDEVRARILVADHDSYIFAGTLREILRIRHGIGDTEIAAALHTASAEDVVDALPEGFATPIGTRARTLSGGQRQRVRLVRALLAEPEVLILIEPTSAVDAHTEARIAERLRQARAGRTTVVLASSPLLLERADTVAHLRGGRIVATGSHAELLEQDATYPALVSRDEDSPDIDDSADAQPVLR